MLDGCPKLGVATVPGRSPAKISPPPIAGFVVEN